MSVLSTSQEAEQLAVYCPVGGKSADARPDRSVASSWQRLADASCLFRRAVLRSLAELRRGQLTVVDRLGAQEFGQVGAGGAAATLTVHDRRFYRAVVLGGALGAAEAYLCGYWDSPDLTAAMRVLAQNEPFLTGLERGLARLLKPLRKAGSWLRRNARAGSRRNVAAHYDLSNQFFALMLDPTMTYSSGIFPSPDATLQQASEEKYDRICRKLQLSPQDQVLEIGSGWGGFAEHAARHYGCHVTTTTISQQQHDFAARRFQKASLENRISLLKQDYRDLRGQFDKLVSVEMIEAVGEQFLPAFFAQCSQLLKPHGSMLLQAITVPDFRYQRYRRSVDFIQQYIFPGGFLPSLGAVTRCLQDVTDMSLFHAEDFGPHYARTLEHWRRNFSDNLPAVRSLGFDERFIRTWHYYLCYCTAGFQQRRIGVAQLLLTKPASRRQPLLSHAR